MKTNKTIKWLGRLIPVGAVLCIAFSTYSYFRDDRLISMLSSMVLCIFLFIVNYRSYLLAIINNDANKPIYKIYVVLVSAMVVVTFLMTIKLVTQLP